MNGDVLKEFLVSLGFKIDEVGLKKFNGGIGTATKLATGLGAAAAAMAVAVTAGVVKVSRSFEDLYYLSQRANASVENIRGISYAFSQLGGDATQAKSAVAAVADFIKLLPGGESVLQGMGVATRNEAGEIRDSVEIMLDLARRWRGMDLARANVEAGMLGIDTATLRVLTRNTDKFFEDYKSRLRETGVDQDAAAEASSRLMQRLREVQAVAVLTADGFLLRLQPALDGAIGLVLRLYDSFQTWNQGSSESRQQIGNLVGAVGDLLGALVDLVKLIWEHVGPAVMWTGKQVFRSLLIWVDAIGHAVRSLAALLRGDWKTAWAEAGEVIKTFADALAERLEIAIRTIKRLWYAVTHRGAAMPEDGAAAAGGGAGAGAGGAGSGASAATGGATPTSTPIKQAFDYFRSKGWSEAAAAGIVANLQSESGSRLRIDAIGDGGKAFGIAQWHPDRQAAFKRWAGKDIRESSFAEQLAFVHHELTAGEDVLAKRAGGKLRGVTSARQAGGVVSRLYERPGKDEAARAREEAARSALAERLFSSGALRSTSPAVTMAQTTTIVVQGSTDAASTGRAVAQEQSRVNAEMVRNMKVAAS